MSRIKSKFTIKVMFWNGDSSERDFLEYTKLEALKEFCNAIDDVKMANIKIIEFIR